jgi:hypothetical protein
VLRNGLILSVRFYAEDSCLRTTNCSGTMVCSPPTTQQVRREQEPPREVRQPVSRDLLPCAATHARTHPTSNGWSPGRPHGDSGVGHCTYQVYLGLLGRPRIQEALGSLQLASARARCVLIRSRDILWRCSKPNLRTALSATSVTRGHPDEQREPRYPGGGQLSSLAGHPLPPGRHGVIWRPSCRAQPSRHGQIEPRRA